ncbi:phospholipase D family protein [Rubrivivax albus]|uniref:phospholipase D family protein n=1 Tax=Rubrivivax albus TaxID=2499835 RepID=UPI002872EBE2|nr:phospholipase D family protein [Rubrivivax albus]
MLVWLTLLAGCSGLPPMPERTTSARLSPSSVTAIGRAVQADNPGDGRSGLRALSDPLDAFVARMLLVRSAEASLDIQYYIWRPDTTGLMLLDALRQAADRGVRVRLLLDDNGIAGLDGRLAALDAHDRVEVRLFNPYPFRTAKALGYVTDFARLNRRMHNKALVADTQAAIVGGRNIGDAYFGADPALDFADLDVLAAGPIADDVAAAFDDYWNSALAYPLAALVDAEPGAAPSSNDDNAAPDVNGDRYRRALRDAPLARDLAAGRLALEWVPMRLVVDPPDKAAAPPERWMAADLTEALGPVREQVDLISPYFVPGAGGTAWLARHPAAGVQVRVVTNSLAATDVAAVHAGYARRRVDLLRAGVRLYELKPEPGRRTGGVWPVGGSSTASLHGKTFAIDRQRVFVGSFNIDPRSLRLNTEMGLVIDSPAMAEAMLKGLDAKLPLSTYALRLTGDGDIEWVEQTPAGEVVHDAEPRASVWRRLLVTLLSWLPIEGLL